LAGGVLYTLGASIGVLDMGHMRGASGAIFGVLAAAAILFPKTKVLVLLIFPMTIVWMVILFTIISLIFILKGENVGGELSHLSGLAMGFAYIKYKPWITQRRMERQKGAWAHKVNQERNFQSEVDRILDKVHREGVNALSNREKQILQEATRREQESDS
jgi:membrane associated rhomboid family serine protease